MNKLFVGILVAIASVFINNSHSYTGDIYGHNLSGSYSKIYVTYNILLCVNLSNSPCAYIELPEGNGVVTNSFTSEQAQEWVELGYLEPLGQGIFVGI